MRQSKYFLKTSKTFSEEDLKIISSKLLKQGGFVQESVAGRFYFLPIGQRVQQKIMRVVKEEMDKAGAQEMVAPILHPIELWKETNRTNTTGFELMKVKDRRESEFALGGTAEEMFVDLIRKYQLSYKDLPFQLYQFSPKFRDEMRARGGLLRVREFIMKDGYSFHSGEEDFKKTYEQMKTVYTAIFERMGLKTDIVESDNGYIGGEYCHEFIVESPIGESRYFAAEDASYAAHEDIAKFKKEQKNTGDKLQELVEVDAERGTTMEDGVAFHNLPLWQQIKDVLFVDEEGRFILAVIRGDLDVNETKLKHAVKCNELRHATEEEIRDIMHSEPGFISPVKIRDLVLSSAELIIVADDSLRTIVNAYGGANKKNRDLMNVNIDRDYIPDMEADIAMARPGDLAENGQPLVEKRGIEVGNIFQLGYHYTTLMKGANFRDEDGSEKPYYMGCYGIGIGRTMATLVEVFHDDKGILWPDMVAPFKVHLLAVGASSGRPKDGKPMASPAPDVYEHAEKIHQMLLEADVEVLYDDREQSAGVKFADSDLIGIPYRVVISAKTLAENSVEIKKRNESEARMVKIEDLVDKLK